MIKSTSYLREKQLFAFILDGRFQTIQDNYADSMLLNVIYHQDSKQPWKTLIEAPYYDSHKQVIQEELWKSIDEDLTPNQEYARYWHGSMVLLRPLLLFFSILEIRFLLGACALFCLLCSCVILWRKQAAATAVCILAGYVLVHGWMSFFCIEYVTTFLVLSWILLAILFLDGKKQELFQKDIRWLFSIAGVITCFFDFLTTETIVFTIPVFLIFTFYYQRCGTENIKTLVKQFFSYAFVFGISYAGMFFIKWIFAALSMGKGAFQGILLVAAERIQGDIGAGLMSTANTSTWERYLGDLWRNLGCLFLFKEHLEFREVLLVCIFTIIVVFSFVYLFRKNESKRCGYILLTLGMLPIIRFLVLSNHSFLHFFFTYRALWISVSCILYYIWICCFKGREKCKRKH